MAITPFAFNPPEGWGNSTVFPTSEENETQVRADLQRLHDQTRDYINNTILQSVDDAIDDCKEYVDEAVEEAILGQLPDHSVTATKLKAGTDTNGAILVNDTSAVGGMAWKTLYTYGTTDMTPGTTDLATGTLYFMYEA